MPGAGSTHASVLGYLATLRLVPWVLLDHMARRFVRKPAGPSPEPIATRPIHRIVDPALAESLATWLLLMVPVGMPLLYFCGGLLAHIGVALTGGAARSIGASMRATGYALGPALLGIAWFDLPLYTIGLDARVYAVFLALAGFVFFYVCAVAMARTHQIHIVRGVVVSLLPLCLLVGVTAARGALILDAPWLEEMLPGQPSPYWVP